MKNIIPTSGNLYVVATPIGNLADITLRAKETLQKVDYIAAEDTRHTRHLLNHLGISKPLISLHDYNEEQRCEKILADLQQGKQIALVSDAGTPLISDPGYILVHKLMSSGIKVIPIPGPCAAIAALSASGLPTDRFIFEGFLPAKSGPRIAKLQLFLKETRTMIFYESVHRIEAMLGAMLEVFEKERVVVIAREITKRYETIRQDSLAALLIWLKEDKEQLHGEFVVLVAGAPESTSKEAHDEAEINRVLTILLKQCPTKQAVQLAAEICHAKRNQVYQLALALDKNSR